jgi:hypothetical protein
MNPVVGWTLAAIAVAVGWSSWGWRGVVVAVTLIAFWLTLQFNRAVRVMRAAAAAPVGHVDSAVMLNAKLRSGMALWEVIALTRSLGQRVDATDEQFRWTDPGGVTVTLKLSRGRVSTWHLNRPPQ